MAAQDKCLFIRNCQANILHNGSDPKCRFCDKPTETIDHTDRSIQANRSDIEIKEKTERTCQLIDMSIPSDSNVSAEEFERLSKYKDLEIEITKMWNVKATNFPVIIGGL